MGTRRLIAADLRVPDDWSPLDPRWRQRIAGTHYAERAVHAGVGQETAVLNPTEIETTEGEAA